MLPSRTSKGWSEQIRSLYDLRTSNFPVYPHTETLNPRYPSQISKPFHNLTTGRQQNTRSTESQLLISTIQECKNLYRWRVWRFTCATSSKQLWTQNLRHNRNPINSIAFPCRKDRKWWEENRWVLTMCRGDGDKPNCDSWTRAERAETATERKRERHEILGALWHVMHSVLDMYITVFHVPCTMFPPHVPHEHQIRPLSLKNYSLIRISN